MKTLLHASASLLAILSLSASARANSDSGAIQGSHINMVVVAEQAKRDDNLKVPTQGGPAACVVFDGGYIEGGDAIAGENPPNASTVSAAMTHMLQAQGFAIGANSSVASLITYQWGVLRPRPRRDISLSNINSNLKARLSLVATNSTVDRLEQDILARRGSGISTHLRDRPDYRDALDLANEGRYFVVITAYDYPSLKNRQVVPLWRVKCSTQETSTSIANAIPAMIANSGPFLGKSLGRPTSERAALVPPVAMNPDQSGSEVYALNAETAGVLDLKIVGEVLKHENAQFAGEDLQDWDESHWDK